MSGEPFLHLWSAHQVLASRSARGFPREPHRGVFALRSLGTVLLLTLRDLGLLLDDLFLSLRCQLGPSASRRHYGLVSFVSYPVG